MLGIKKAHTNNNAKLVIRLACGSSLDLEFTDTQELMRIVDELKNPERKYFSVPAASDADKRQRTIFINQITMISVLA